MRGMDPGSARGREKAARRRYEAAEARQMERCDRMLAEEEELKRPERMRCQCGGVILKGHVQEHHCKYLHRQDWRSVA